MFSHTLPLYDFVTSPVTSPITAYENFHRQLAWRVTRIHDDTRLLTTEEQRNKTSLSAASKLSILIIESDTDQHHQPPPHHSSTTGTTTAAPVNNNKGLKTLFKKNSWHVRTCRSLGDWDEKYLSCHCVLIDMQTIPFMQSRDGIGPSGSVNDLSVVSLLRVLGYKMIIAQIEKTNKSNGSEVTLQRASSLGIATLEESKSASTTQNNNPSHHHSVVTNTTTTTSSNGFDFTFNETNSSRAGIHQVGLPLFLPYFQPHPTPRPLLLPHPPLSSLSSPFSPSRPTLPPPPVPFTPPSDPLISTN